MYASAIDEKVLGLTSRTGSALALGLVTFLSLPSTACSKQEVRVLAPDASCQGDDQCALAWSCFNGTCQDLRIEFLEPPEDRHIGNGLLQVRFGLPGAQPAELASR